VDEVAADLEQVIARVARQDVVADAAARPAN
jgi:hypothetical protein